MAFSFIYYVFCSESFIQSNSIYDTSFRREISDSLQNFCLSLKSDSVTTTYFYDPKTGDHCSIDLKNKRSPDIFYRKSGKNYFIDRIVLLRPKNFYEHEPKLHYDALILVSGKIPSPQKKNKVAKLIEPKIKPLFEDDFYLDLQGDSLTRTPFFVASHSNSFILQSLVMATGNALFSRKSEKGPLIAEIKDNPFVDLQRLAFPHVGGLTLSKAFYYSGITMLTVGYGDIVPITDATRILSIIQAVLGVCLLAAFTAIAYSRK